MNGDWLFICRLVGDSSSGKLQQEVEECSSEEAAALFLRMRMVEGVKMDRTSGHFLADGSLKEEHARMNLIALTLKRPW